MAGVQKHPLRVLTPQEEQELHRVVKATSERLDVVKRARVLLAVRAGQRFTDATSGSIAIFYCVGFRLVPPARLLERKCNATGLGN